jgi:virginiamycin B lyase
LAGRRLVVAFACAVVAWLVFAAGEAGAASYITKLPVPGGRTLTEFGGPTLGPDGNVWFTACWHQPPGCGFGRVTPAGEITLFDLSDPQPSVCPGSLYPGGIASADGSLWVEVYHQDPLFGSCDYIYRVGLDGRVTSRFLIPTNPTSPGEASVLPHLAAGPDGSIWFVGPDRNEIGRLTLSGDVTWFTRGISQNAGIGSIVAGPDGNLWFAEADGDKVGRITPAGVVTEFPAEGALPSGITVGPDHNLWFVGGGGIGSITTTGQVTVAQPPVPELDAYHYYSLPSGEQSSGLFPGAANDIAAASDGHLWFEVPGTPSLERWSNDGTITFVAAGSEDDPGYPGPMVSGADGDLYFPDSVSGAAAGFAVNDIGRLDPRAVPAPPRPGNPPSSSSHIGVRLPRLPKLAAALSRGLAVTVHCTAACRAVGRLRWLPRHGKNLRVVAHGTTTGKHRGNLRLVLRFSPAAKHSLAHRKHVLLTLRVVVNEMDASRMFTRTLTLVGR